MAKSRSSKAEFVPHERYDMSHPLLRELVLVHVDVDYDTPFAKSFDTLLTRVPGIGEEISREDKSYRVVRVQHEPVDDDGRARLGWHAFIEADLLPPEDGDLRLPKRRTAKRKKSMFRPTPVEER